MILVGEHGDYSWNEQGQQLFPRKFFMEQICGVFATSGRSVPIFSDKHLSWSWDDAVWMVERARELQAPFMAGSSLPLTHRSPDLEHPLDCPLEEAVAVGHSGLDVYGSHTLDILQCMTERRKGGESGVRAVTYMCGSAVWQAGKEGVFSMELLRAACSAIDPPPEGDIEERCALPDLILIEHLDGFRSAILMLNGYINTLAYAGRVGGAVRMIQACEFRAGGSTPHAGPGPRPKHWLDNALGGRSPFWRYYGHFAYFPRTLRRVSAHTHHHLPLHRVQRVRL